MNEWARQDGRGQRCSTSPPQTTTCSSSPATCRTPTSSRRGGTRTAGKPRDREAARRRAQALQGVYCAVAHAVRLHRVGEDNLAAVGVQPLLLLQRRRRRGARRHARLVHRHRPRQRAAPVAPARPRRGGPGPDGVRGGAGARTVVQQQQGAQGGGRRHARRHGGHALRRARGRGVRGPRARVREVRACVQRQGGPVRAGVRDHRRRREQGGARGEVRGPAAEDLRVPGGELRARAARGREHDARGVDVAPERRRRGGRRRPGLDHQPRGQSSLQQKQEQIVIRSSRYTSA
jgi:hypothetical protein